MYGSHIGTLNLYELVGSTETLIWTLAGNKGNKWFSGQVAVGNVTGYKVWCVSACSVSNDSCLKSHCALLFFTVLQSNDSSVYEE